MNEHFRLNAAGDLEPCTALEWADWFASNDPRRVVAQTYFGDVLVSTVLIGHNYRFGAGTPLIYESMVFGGAYDDEMDRYSTLEEALAGHHRLCDLVAASLNSNSGEIV